MFEGAFSPMHWLVVLVIAVVIFGPSKLPEIGKSLGTAVRGFREGMGGASKEGKGSDPEPAKKSPDPGK